MDCHFTLLPTKLCLPVNGALLTSVWTLVLILQFHINVYGYIIFYIMMTFKWNLVPRLCCWISLELY